MNLRDLKRQHTQCSSTLELISQEGDTYLCIIDQNQLLTTGKHSEPYIFHSIDHARSILGKSLELIYSSPYDEMI